MYSIVVQIHIIIVTDIRDLVSHLKVFTLLTFFPDYSLYVHHMELCCSNSKWLLN